MYHWPGVYGNCIHLLLYFYEWQLTEKYLRSNKTCTLFLAQFEIHGWKYEAKYSKSDRSVKGRKMNSVGEKETEKESEREKVCENWNRESIHEVIIQFHWTNNNIIIPNTFPTIQFYFNCFIVRLGSLFFFCFYIF